MAGKELKLIKGGKPGKYAFSGIQLVVTTRKALTDKSEIMVFEEDTKMVLTVDREIRYRKEHPIRLMTDVHNAPNHLPGSLVVNGKNRYALVIDLDADPVCQTQWIEAAYREIFNTIQTEKIVSAAMHVLGSIHGKIPVDQALEVFFEGVKNRSPSQLKKIYLVVTETDLISIHKLLVSALKQGSSGG